MGYVRGTAKVITVEKSWGRNVARSGDLLVAFGLKAGGHLPAEGLGEMVIDGVRVYVAPLVAGGNRRRGHRVIAICACGRHVPAGRLHQHKCKAPAFKNQEGV